MELDHLFLLTTPDAPELEKLAALGLTPTYRRTHIGQGTANVCYCFDNAFLEILWVTSDVEAASPSVARMQLDQRARWRTARTNPFGIAWRQTGDETVDETTTWPCKPPYLPPSVAIAVATDSDDLTQPLMFAFPGSRAPSEWPEARRGTLQQAGGFSRMDIDTVWLPRGVQPSTTLRRIAASCGSTISIHDTNDHALDLRLARQDDTEWVTLRIPQCAILR